MAGKSKTERLTPVIGCRGSVRKDWDETEAEKKVPDCGNSVGSKRYCKGDRKCEDDIPVFKDTGDWSEVDDGVIGGCGPEESCSRSGEKFRRQLFYV